MPDLLTTIKQAAVAAVNASNPLTVMFAAITKINPLEVLVDQRFALDADFLVIPESLTEQSITVDGIKYVIRKGLQLGDKVILLRLAGGQQYVVLDRVVNA